ncbi:MAG TPA: RidA family protein [Candidatus Nanopelagicales bacterium]|jgi:enamine deaminase RidA (YjgF/YER057c/UK114 family)|nr:RidA family protein [Candidatus Nanopelagicales bacterium]
MSPAFTAIEPEQFPWFDHRGYTFSLGLQLGEDVLCSGHSGSAFDPVKGKPEVRGGMTEQTQTAYAKAAAILGAAGMTFADVTRVVENVTIAGLGDYAEAVEVREKLFAGHRPTIVTVVVDRLVRGRALIEVEVHASRGGGQALVVGDDGSWRRETVRAGHDGSVYLPTLLPIDADGEIVAEGDVVGQYSYCLERAGELLERAGLSLSHLVSTVDYSTPATRERYPKTGRARRDLLGPVYPGAAGILMSRLHRPGVLVAVDAIASRYLPEPVNPGWDRYDTLTYLPGLKAGNTLYMSGFASLDMHTQQATHVGDLRRQAEATYGAIAETLAVVGATPADLLTTVEYVVPAGLADYRVVADVRQDILSAPYPASTGIVCGGLLRDEFLLEVVPTALIPAAS